MTQTWHQIYHNTQDVASNNNHVLLYKMNEIASQSSTDSRCGFKIQVNSLSSFENILIDTLHMFNELKKKVNPSQFDNFCNQKHINSWLKIQRKKCLVDGQYL